MHDQAKCDCNQGWAGDGCTTIVRVPKFEDTLALDFVFGFSTDGVQTDKNGVIPVKPFLGKDVHLSDWGSWSFLLYFLSEARKVPELLIRAETIQEQSWIEEFYENAMNETFGFELPGNFYGANYTDLEAYFQEEKWDESEIDAWMKELWYGTQRSTRRLFARADPMKRARAKSEPGLGEAVQCSHENVILNPFMKKVSDEKHVYDPIAFEKMLWNFMLSQRKEEVGLVGFQPGIPELSNFTGQSLEWLKLRINIDVKKTASATDLAPIYDLWNNFVRTMNAQCGHDSIGNAVMVAEKFTTMDQELSLISSTINGFMTSNLICFCAVLFFTGDIVISFYTMAAIFMIVVTLLGILFGMLGWTFGAIEAVGVTIFVGMSVDYCLHTAHAYSHSESETRRGKVTDALTHMGISILGAFVTTVGSTVFLFPTWIYLFFQLGLMMFANTILAVVFSFFFLSGMLMAFGPTGGCGNVVNILSCKALRDIGKMEALLEAQEDGEELEEEVFDPHSLVGQIEATAAREEAEQKIALEIARIEAHNRLEARKVRRRASSKKQLSNQVVPVEKEAKMEAAGKKTIEKNEDVGEDI